MATRLYPFSTLVSAYNPTPNGGWTVTTSNVYAVLMKEKMYPISSGGNITSAVTGGAAARKIIIRSFITQPLAAQTILSSSTISGQWRESISSTNSRSGQGWWYFRLMNEDGTIASEIGSASTTNLTTSATNRTFTLTLGSNVVITANQRIVIEMGWNYLTGSDVNTTSLVSMGVNPATADLPIDNTTTTNLNDWVEFSQTLIIANGGYGKLF